MSTRPSPAALEELLSNSVDAIMVLDESGIIQYTGPSVRRIFGYDPDELVGDEVFEYVHPDNRSTVIDRFHNLVESSTGESTSSVELRFRHKNSEWIWIETRGSNQKGSEIGGYVLTSRDITERKEYERSLKRERDRFERFVGVVSHDLRDPVNVAAGHVELAQEECESEHLTAAAQSLDRMGALIEDLSTAVHEGTVEPQLDAVTLREMGETCWQNVETNAATLDIRTDQRILADESRFQRLLGNLMRNAVEHGGDAVTVTIGELADGFYISDDGRGLPEGDPDALLEYGVSTKTNGTGLGLSIAKEVAQNHDWTLTVRDGDDGGARFEISGVTFV